MSGERTEAATPRRLAKLREDGKGPRSQELGPTVGLLAGLLIVQMTAASAGARLQGILTGSLSDLNPPAQGDLLWAQQALGRAGEAWLLSVAPLLVVLPVLGIGIGFAQGSIFSFKSLFSGWSNLNPFNGVKRLFSMQSLVGLGRALIKVGLVGWVTWRGLQQSLERLPQIEGTANPRVLAAFIGQSIMDLAMPAAEVLLVLAIADYAYQRWNFARNARMSKQEVKEEHKQQEGDPHVKGQIRARQRKMAGARRQLQDVPKATVVVTNPTHFAVALQYDRTLISPRVVAKGADLMAQRIKDVAREAGVPIVENKPLARGLFGAVEVGEDIPIELYQAVAEVLAYVFSLKNRRRRR
jgi:flagellar biosynthesis protein FlhB